MVLGGGRWFRRRPGSLQKFFYAVLLILLAHVSFVLCCGGPSDTVPVSACRRSSSPSTPPRDLVSVDTDDFMRVRVLALHPTFASVRSCSLATIDELHSPYIYRTMVVADYRSEYELELKIPLNIRSVSAFFSCHSLRLLNFPDLLSQVLQSTNSLRIAGPNQPWLLRYRVDQCSMSYYSVGSQLPMTKVVSTEDFQHRHCISLQGRYDLLTPYVLNRLNTKFLVNMGKSHHGISMGVVTLSYVPIYRRFIPTVVRICYHHNVALLLGHLVPTLFVSISHSRFYLDELWQVWHFNTVVSLFSIDYAFTCSSPENHWTTLEETTTADQIFQKLGRTIILCMGFRPMKLHFVQFPSLSGHEPKNPYPLFQSLKLGLHLLVFNLKRVCIIAWAFSLFCIRSTSAKSVDSKRLTM